jgi:transposase
MPIRYSKLSNYRLKKLLRCFCEGLTATQTAKISGINRDTVDHYYRTFGEEVSSYQESVNRGFRGEVELDESYFGGKGKGRGGRGTARIPVLGILRRNRGAYTQIIRNATKRQMRPIIKQFLRPGSTIYLY